ncbi:MAG: response regulator transcription factor [Chitinophagales bacterium]|nr:response regulator transcription factor [Chitinophagales bacterium]
MKTKLLYVEDEVNLGRIVSETLLQQGFDVLLIKDGAKVIESCISFSPDICVLDVMLPHIDGYELGKKIRERFSQLPIIFLTAKTQTNDVVKGFESGGTDYMRKPFSMGELIARINNQLQLVNRQVVPDGNEEIPLSAFTFYPKKLELHRDGYVIKLSSREAEILQLLAAHVNRPLERKMLLMRVWGDDSFFHSRNLDVYIRKLRGYFQEDSGVEIITLKGKGYQFMVEK